MMNRRSLLLTALATPFIIRTSGLLMPISSLKHDVISERLKAYIDVEQYLSDLSNRGVIYDYAVICDTTNNTPVDMKLNQINVEVAFKLRANEEFLCVIGGDRIGVLNAIKSYEPLLVDSI